MLTMMNEVKESETFWYVVSMMMTYAVYIFFQESGQIVWIVYTIGLLVLSMLLLLDAMKSIDVQKIIIIFAEFIFTGLASLVIFANHLSMAFAVNETFILLSRSNFYLLGKLAMFYSISIGILICASWAYLAMQNKNS